MTYERTRGSYMVTTDRPRLDLAAVHAFLVHAYGCEGVPRELLARAIANSLCFSLLEEGSGQVGLARVCTDSATFAYLMDVYVLPDHGGTGPEALLPANFMDHQQLTGLPRKI